MLGLSRKGIKMDIEKCAVLIQNYLQNNPLVVIGSGGTMKYGLPSMSNLAQELSSQSHIDSSYTDLCSKLISGIDLEAAMNTTALSDEAVTFLRRTVWEYINGKDLEYLNNIDTNNGIVQLLKRLLQPSGNRCTIVTTNYDRIVEYSADIAKAIPVTGFEGSLIKEFEPPTASLYNKRIQARNKFVEIWKVHGSLDWFYTASNNIRSYPLSKNILNGHTPLIVPPGNTKMATTHLEPYRTIIQQADNSILRASCYLCVGYGFNDEHIQQKVIDEIHKGKPIVVLAKTMTAKCKELITGGAVSKFLVIEDGGNNTSIITTPTESAAIAGNLWSLDEFLKVW